MKLAEGDKKQASKQKSLMRAAAQVHGCISYICVCVFVYTTEAKISLAAGEASPL